MTNINDSMCSLSYCSNDLSSGDTEEDKKLLMPFKYILQFGGKETHKKLTSALNHWMKVPSDRFQQINEIIYDFHYIHLMFDDIQDNSFSREGSPAAHFIYGLSTAFNSGYYMLSIALEKIINLHPMAIRIVVEELQEYNKGQGIDMYWKENFICPNERDYKIMAVRKCAWLIKLTVRLLQLFSTYEGDFTSLINLLGLYHQIHNDYCNFFVSMQDTKSESYCSDVTEGKFSFLMVHAVTHNPDDEQIINILKRRTNKIEVKHHCIKLLKNFGSFKYTRDVLKELNEKVRIEIERLGGNPLLLDILNEYEMVIADDACLQT